MSFSATVENTIVKCNNPICQATFSVTMYVFGDEDCRIINAAQMIPLTGNTPYYCPVCGKNLGLLK